MKVLISGDRHWLSQKPIADRLRQLPPDTIIIHGDGDGVDGIAGFVGEILGFEVRAYPALAHGRVWPSAGPLRNSEMLEKEHPDKNGKYIDLALIWHRQKDLHKGTKDMHGKLLKADPPIPVEIKIDPKG